ncbi:MAG TPA: AMP-binding protein, partial [Acidimicrobiia bacterium]|nr:AMP-binding protein [Acidimicrobiia bacterium]
MPTIAELVRARAADDHPAILFEDRSWSYAEYVTACAERAALLEELRRPGPFHVGVLLDNVPEFALWLGAAAVAGAVIVGINPTRRGAELARDITHTECQLLVTEDRYAPLLDGIETGVGPERTFDVESAAYTEALDRHRGAALPDVEIADSDLYLLLFTSGTSGAPKACLCSQGRLGRIGRALAGMVKL